MAKALLPGLSTRVSTAKVAVVHGKLADKHMALWKPASIPLTLGEGGGGVVQSAMQQLLHGQRMPLFFPSALRCEDAGLQIVCRGDHAAQAVETALRSGVCHQEFAVIVRLPKCLVDTGRCRQTFPLPDAWEDGKLSRSFSIRASVVRAGADRPGLRKDHARVGRLFGVESPAGSECVGGPCSACVQGKHPYAFPVSCAPASGVTGPDVSADVLLVGTSAERRCALLKVSARDCDTTRLRAALAASGLPVLNDPVHDREYVTEVAARAGEGAGYDEAMWRGHHMDVLSSVTGRMPMALARTMIAFPDPGSGHNLRQLRMRHTGALKTDWQWVQLTAALPLGWQEWIRSGTPPFGAEHAWAADSVSVAVGEAANSEEVVEVKAVQTAKKPQCAYCGGKHWVADCPRLNSVTRQDELEGQLSELAGVAAKFCVLCCVPGHDVVSCPRRKRGVDPDVACAYCGSGSHDVWGCRRAAEAGLADRAKADQFAAECGYSGWSDLHNSRLRAAATQTSRRRLTALRGRENDFEGMIRGEGDEGGYTLEDEVRDPQRSVHRKRHQRWLQNNFGSVLLRKRNARLARKEASRSLADGVTGVSTLLSEPVRPQPGDIGYRTFGKPYKF
eukprot:TRINITY_DN15967_c0_g1_i1.p1 TRINITY_DN15967_c0_g1~~TRINITY_DN15967_c0_g1_i1.p1  ORF type:complete len:637 (+),score=154.92 TRINITY_DN15967_c0_g1_i1:59-1912(+)